MDKIKELIAKAQAWIGANKMLALGLLAAIIFIFFRRQAKRLLFGRNRKKRRRKYAIPVNSGRTRSGRTLPRSVGTRASGKGYPAAGGGTIPFKYNKDGTIKKAWQVAGTLAAKNRMSRLRKRA